jgi:hypothetical protein
MKTIIAILTCFVLLSSCQDDFDLDNPNVSKFVSQLKKGTYDGGEMPAFTIKHVPQLIEHATDTSHILDLSCIPVNPISSRSPVPNYRQYMILGEYLLWCTQYAINGHFPSLDPLLVNTNEEQIRKGITAKEVLQVQEQYQKWWLLYGDKDNPDEVQPLDGTPFRWF